MSWDAPDDILYCSTQHMNGEQALVTNGLKAGDKVAANALEVSEGMKVR